VSLIIGVFITTSRFSDGDKLAEYIYDFGLGMQEEKTVVIKKMDANFWEGMKDN